MSILLPVFILVATLIAQIGSNRLQPNFRSYWLVSAAGLALTAASLLILRLRLPSQLMFSGWWVGQGLEFPLNFALGPHSWPLAFAVLALFAAGLLVELRRPGTASWQPWAPGLALGAVGLLAISAGDLLAFAFTFFLFDLLAFALQIGVAKEGEHQALIVRFGANLAGIVLVLLAWTTPASYASFANIAILLAAALRLLVSLRVPAPTENVRFDFYTVLQFGPVASAVALLGILPPLEGALQLLVLLPLLLLAIRAALRWLSLPAEDALQNYRTGLAALALAAACVGAPSATLAFGISLLLSHSLLALPATFPRLRWPLAALAFIALTGLPFTPMHAALGLYTAGGPVIFAFLLPQALLLAGFALRLFARDRNAEANSRAQQAGALLLPVTFFLFGLGLAPSMAADFTLPLWPVAVLLALTALVFALVRSGRRLFPPHLGARLGNLPSFAAAGRAIMRAGNFALGLVNELLEGEAGVIWALLLIALLISFVSQLGFSG